jgi:hypothetical protein
LPRSSALVPALRSALALAGAVLALPALPHALAAQVGYEPARSPFQDLEYRQGLTLTGGYLAASAGRGGVGPTGGPLAGVRYDLLMAGPAWFTARVQGVASERTVIDPARDAGDREIGTEQRPLTLLDVGLSIALTGQKSYRRLVPLVHAGAGIASNFQGADPGGFRFGTRFALAYGAGVRWVPPGRRLAYRADLGWHLYQVRFPGSYFQPGLDGTQVFPAGQSNSSWQNNMAITVGASYQFRR